jgi:glycine dehydrogenase subunit 1
VRVLNERFFNEFTIELPVAARPALRAMAEMGVLGGVACARLWPGEVRLENAMTVAVTECVSDADVDALVRAVKECVR